MQREAWSPVPLVTVLLLLFPVPLVSMSPLPGARQKAFAERTHDLARMTLALSTATCANNR